MPIVKKELDSDPEWLKLAWADNGTKEIAGRKHNPKVVQYYKDVGHGWVKDDETAWCAAFVGSCLARSGLPHTKSLAARSYLQWGKKTDKPKRGDVVVFKRGNSSWQGHVAFYVGQSSSRIYVLGGNQSNAVNVRSYPKSKLLGYRKPVTLRNSRTLKGAAMGGAASLAVLGEGMRQASETLTVSGSEWMLVLASFVGLAAVGIVTYARINDWEEKGR